jgi:cytoskeleton protein RodZ
MVGFTKKRIGTLTLGEKLRKLRSDKRLSLGEASRVTRIQVKYLEYLEEGRYEKLPADVYIKGFLRSYGDFLGADGVVLIRIYDKEREIQKNIKKEKTGQYPKKTSSINISPFILTPKKILALVASLTFFWALYYLYLEVGSFANAPRLALVTPESNTEIDSNSVYIEGLTDKDALLYINDQPILVNDDGKFRENIALRSGANTIRVKAVNRFKKEAEEEILVRANFKDDSENDASDSEKQENLSDSGDKTIPNQDEISIDIKVDPGPVWVSVESDGNLVFSGTMLSGSSQEFKAKDKIVINSGKANATYIKFNGKEIGALSQEAGPVRGVTFNKDIKY